MRLCTLETFHDRTTAIHYYTAQQGNSLIGASSLIHFSYSQTTNREHRVSRITADLTSMF